MPGYQFAVCAKDLAVPMAGLQAIVNLVVDGHNVEEVGRTEVLTETTVHPIWRHLVVTDKGNEDDNDNDGNSSQPLFSSLADATFQVQIVQTTSTTADTTYLHSEPRVVASATMEGHDLTRAHYHAVARYTTELGDEAAKICLHAQPLQKQGTLHLQLAAHDLPDADYGMFSVLPRFATRKSKNNRHHCNALVELYSSVTGLKVEETTVMDNELNPTWPSLELDVDVLCGGNRKAPIRMTVLDQHNNKTQ